MKGEIVLLFEIDLYSGMTNKDWKVTRSFSEFKLLNLNLFKGFQEMPPFPTVPLHREQDYNFLRISLQNYLNDLITRSDMINCLHLKNFLELENHFTSYMQFQPMLVNEVNESMEVTDILFSKTQNLLFTGMAYSSSSGGISSYLTSLTSLWNSSSLGSVGIYHLAKSNYGELHLEKVFAQDLASQVSKMYFIEEDCLLILGLFDGSIWIYKIYTSEQTFKVRNLVDFAAKMKPHKNRIIGFGVNPKVGYIYSAAQNEKAIVISEMNYQSVISTYTVSKSALSNFCYDADNKKIFVTDVAGSLWILKIENNINIKIVTAIHDTVSFDCIKIYPDRNFIFAGGKGVIRFYEWDGEDTRYPTIAKRLDISTGKFKVNDIIYDAHKSTVISALANGSIYFNSHSADMPEFLNDNHDKSVNRILFDEESRIIFSCSSDMTVKIWQLPSDWPSEIMRNDKEYNQKFVIEENTVHKNNIMKIQDALKDIDFKDDEFETNNENENIMKENEVADTSNEQDEKLEENIETNSKSQEMQSGSILEYEDDSDLENLDGWDNEDPLEKPDKKLDRVYDFMGI